MRADIKKEAAMGSLRVPLSGAVHAREQNVEPGAGAGGESLSRSSRMGVSFMESLLLPPYHTCQRRANATR